MNTKTQATVEDLHQVPDKAEIIKGEVVIMPPTGGDPGYAGDDIVLCAIRTSMIYGYQSLS